MPPTINLPLELAQRLGVTNQIDCFDGGQKYVFIVDCDGQRCVVKMLKHVDPDRDTRELEFYLANSDHIGIPKVKSHFYHGNDMIVVEEYIEGSSLAELVERGSYLNNGPAIAWLLDRICTIMNPFWEKDIVHRDLKPDNIIIQPNWEPVVIDFGIYKNPANSTITSTNFQPHSWQFCAPEQLIPDKNSISNRTDYFSLGVIAYKLKYGILPFGQTKEEVEAKYLTEDLSFSVQQGCMFTNFWKNVFQKSIASRPRNTKLFLQGIDI